MIAQIRIEDFTGAADARRMRAAVADEAVEPSVAAMFARDIPGPGEGAEIFADRFVFAAGGGHDFCGSENALRPLEHSHRPPLLVAQGVMRHRRGGGFDSGFLGRHRIHFIPPGVPRAA